ncbi:MAG: hypothetical protein NZM31_01835 [Gemmatales bacterium]|nr:hypothetical protein [Gemmatales bacterium]MDW8385737.1 hypothetical protein [Gemmatales bacterium]
MMKSLTGASPSVVDKIPPSQFLGSQQPSVLTLEQLDRINRQHDWILAALTVLLAFLLASFPVLNSDIWIQLRTGQMISAGEFDFGLDPYTYPNPQLWVHTAWLWDVLVYAVYSLGGGPALVILRGVLIVALTLVLFQIRRRDVSLFPVVLCLSVALVAMSARIILRSEVISLLFLGVTLWLLYPTSSWTRLPGTTWLGKWSDRPAWLFLPPLFALWANFDYWFFLGPLTVALFLLGQSAQAVLSSSQPELTPRDRKTLGGIFLVGLAACLINPYMFRIFLQLPGDVSSKTLDLILLNQPTLRQGWLRPLLSPFSPDYFQSPLRDLLWWRPLGLTLAEWTFYPLTALGLISFVTVWRKPQLWRLFVWAGFFALAAWQARNVPFFAVVAGPIAALNFQDWLASRRAVFRTWTRAELIGGQLGRMVLLPVLLALCFLMTVRQSTATLDIRGRESALGVIHNRALGWSLGVDPSLQRSAQALAEWKLPGQVFNLDWREQPAYQIFFAPGSKVFLDTRLTLHGNYAAEYFSIVNALQETNPMRSDKRPTIHHFHWQDAFRKYDISHIVVSRNILVARPNPNVPGGADYVPLVDLLLADEIETRQPGEPVVRRKVWEMLDYLDGRTFILAWTGSPHFPALKTYLMDQEAEAFHRPRRVPPAHGPRGGEQLSPLAVWLAGDVDRPPAAGDEANWLLEYSTNAYARSQRQAIFAALQMLTATPALSGPHTGVFAVPLLGMEPLSLAPQYLAIRAARRAIAEQPDSAISWYRLFQAYAEIYGLEREWGTPNALREAQLVTALREAVRLRPQEPLLHMELSLLYLRKNLGDLAVKHYEEAFRTAQALGFSSEQFQNQLRTRPDTAHLLPLLAVMPQEQQSISKRKASFNARAALTTDAAERARVAAQLGLNDELRQALEAVVSELQMKPQQQATDASLHQLLDLYLQIGYTVEAVRLLARPDVPGRLGPAAFYQRAALVRAAIGDYAGSVQHFQQFEEILRKTAVERAILGVGLHTRGSQSEFPGSVVIGLEQLFEADSLNLERADVMYQAGLVALEAGWTSPSEDHPDAPALFRKAVVEIEPNFPQAILARRYHRLITGRWAEDAALQLTSP